MFDDVIDDLPVLDLCELVINVRIVETINPRSFGTAFLCES